MLKIKNMKQLILITFFCFVTSFSIQANATPLFTNEKHEELLLNNQEYAIADSMLNLTWQTIIKQLPKKELDIIKKEQIEWLESGRSEMASYFIVEFKEEEAFMVSVVARVQQLSQKIWQPAQEGNYIFEDKVITITKEDDNLYLQGYANIINPMLTQNTSQKNTNKNTKEKKKETTKQLLFRAELPQEKLWIATKTVANQTIYFLTINEGICIVHAPNAFPVSFQGVYKKQ